MKIALFTETYLPHINGVVTHVHSLRQGLEQLGHEVLVVCADHHYQTHQIKDGVLYCPGYLSKKFYGFTLSKPYSKEREKWVAGFQPDLIHIHTEFGIGIFGKHMAKVLQVPLVYTLHTMYDDYLYYIAPKPLLGLVKPVSHRYFASFAKAAAAITGPSQKCQEYVIRIGADKTVAVIPNPVELDLFDPEKVSNQQKQQVLNALGLSKDWLIAAFVGRLGKEKSVDVLLDYWAKSVRPEDKIHLLIIGEGPERPALEQRCRQLGITDLVTFTGKIPHEELPPYYGICKFYVTASLSDTNSISMLEAMAFGLPVLQRLDHLNEDQVQEGKNGFVFNSQAEFQQKLSQLRIWQPQDWQAQAARVRASVVQKGCTALAGHLLAVYAQALQAKNNVKK